MSDTPLHYRTITELAAGIARREFSPVELAEHFLARIEALDGALGAYRLVSPERARAAARSAQAALESGRDLGPLAGVPYAVKDLYDAKGLPTTAGTHLLADNVASADSAAVARLAAAGMVLLGKTNTVQFAYGGAGINHDHGTPHNPWHATPHLPGGSSSGSGVAVAAGLAPMALGSDTGGSVRIPSSLCGVTGLKTTVGQVSRAGVYPLSWSLDSVGPLARSVEDTALIYQVLQGEDPADPSTAGRAPQDVLGALHAGVRGLRVAFAESVFWDEADPEVAAACRAAGDVFRDLGASVASVEFREADEARALNPRGLVIAAEAYTLNRRLVDEHFDDLDPIVAHRIVKGRDIPAHEYLQTTLDWQRLRARAAGAMRDVDALLCPATMIPAHPVQALEASIEAYSDINLKCLRNTAIGNILGLCGLSVPCGLTRGGLPIGLMIYGRAFDEPTLLRVGHAFQTATDWHRRTPDLGWI